ncbi:MAG: DUF2493 domain-containing protein [Bradymonadia bacterium]
MPIVLIVCGGRDYADQQAAFHALDTLHQHGRGPVDHIIEGGARGADALGRAWAQSRGVAVTTCPARWDKFGKRAGLLRNQQMLDDFEIDLVVAFPGGRGTADMIRRARQAQVQVWRTGGWRASRQQSLDQL